MQFAEGLWITDNNAKLSSDCVISTNDDNDDGVDDNNSLMIVGREVFISSIIPFTCFFILHRARLLFILRQLHESTLHCIALHCIVLHYIVSYYITLHCIVLHYIVLYYIALYRITLHCIIFRYIEFKDLKKSFEKFQTLRSMAFHTPTFYSYSCGWTCCSSLLLIVVFTVITFYES